MDDMQEVRTEKSTQRDPWEGPSTRIDTISSFDNEARGDRSLVDGPSVEMRDGPATFSASSAGSAIRATHFESSSRRFVGERDSKRILVRVPGIEYYGGTYLLKDLKVYEQRRAIVSPVDNQLDHFHRLEAPLKSSSLDLILAARSDGVSEEVTSSGSSSLDSILKVDDEIIESRRSVSTGRKQNSIVLPTHEDRCESRGRPAASSSEESNDEGSRGDARCEQTMTEQRDGIRCESVVNNASESIVDESSKSSRVAGIVTDAESFDYLVLESIWRAPPSESHDPFDDVLVFTTCFDNELEQSSIREALDSISKRLSVLPAVAPADAEAEASGSNNVDDSYTDMVPERAWSDDPFDEIFYFTTDFDFEVDQQAVHEALQSITSKLKKDEFHRSRLVIVRQPHGVPIPSDDGLGVNRENCKEHDNDISARTSLQSDHEDAQSLSDVGTSHDSSSPLSRPLPTAIHFEKLDSNPKTQQSKSSGGEDFFNTVSDSRRINFDEADIKSNGDDIPVEENLLTLVPNSGFNDEVVDDLPPAYAEHCSLLSPLTHVSQRTESDTVQSGKVVLSECGRFDTIIEGVLFESTSSVPPEDEINSLNKTATSEHVDTYSALLQQSFESFHSSSSAMDVPLERVWSVDPFDEVFYFTTDFDFEIDQHQIQEALQSMNTRIQEVKVFMDPHMGEGSGDPRADGLCRNKLDAMRQGHDETVTPSSGISPALLDGLVHSHSMLDGLQKSLPQVPVQVSNAETEGRGAAGHAATNARQLDEGIEPGLSLHQKDDQSKLSRLWHYLENALVEASMTPDSEDDDGEVQLAQGSDALSTTTSSDDVDGTLSDSFSTGSTTEEVPDSVEAVAHLPNTINELPSSELEAETERCQSVDESVDESLAASDSPVCRVAEI